MRLRVKIKKQKSEGCVGTGVTTPSVAHPPSWDTSESLGPGRGQRSHLQPNADLPFLPMCSLLLSTRTVEDEKGLPRRRIPWFPAAWTGGAGLLTPDWGIF